MLHKNIPYRRLVARRHKKHLEFLSDRLGYFPSGACKVERDGKVFYRRYYRPRFSQYLKKQSAKKFRRIDLEITSPNQRNLCRKVYDFWWELY